jgi:hypothetical protein
VDYHQWSKNGNHFLEVIPCREEMEQDHQREAHRGVAGWEVPVPGLDPVGIASVLIAGQRFHTKEVLPATI